MTTSLRPRYSELVRDKNRNEAQLRLLLGTRDFSLSPTSILVRSRLDSPARAILTRNLVDLLVRLDPLVIEVGLETPDNERCIGDLRERFPVQVEPSARTDWTQVISVGGDCEKGFLVDADGWSAYLGRNASGNDDSNPIGALVAACLAAGEAFKRLLVESFPDTTVSKRLVLSKSLTFSALTYDSRVDSSPIQDVSIDATLVGAGGVGAGVVQTFLELRDKISGSLRVVDHDRLGAENLNRHLYARIGEATASPPSFKVDSVARALEQCENLRTDPVPTDFGTLKRRLSPRRNERVYRLILAAVDSDISRTELQLELPCNLLDGATGSFANCRVERVDFLDGECLACRAAVQPATTSPEREGALADLGECGRLSGSPAPSLPFLSMLPGVFMAGEVLKDSLAPARSLRGYFEHVFLYPPNPSNAGMPAKSRRCTIHCDSPAMVRAFKEKCSQTA